jgi:hypothetical protein
LRIADRNVERMKDYSILNEEDYSERESEEADSVWCHCYSWQERIRYIRENASQFDFNDYADMLACVRGKHFAGYASELLS